MQSSEANDLTPIDERRNLWYSLGCISARRADRGVSPSSQNGKGKAAFQGGFDAGLKFLLKEHVSQSIAGIFLISIPYWDPEDQEGEDYPLHEGFASQLPKGVPVFLYHSRDDEVVPFAHLEIYAEKIPQATIRTFDDRGHQFTNDLSEVAADMISLQERKRNER